MTSFDPETTFNTPFFKNNTPGIFMYREFIKFFLSILSLAFLLLALPAQGQTSDFNLPDLGDESHSVMSPLEQKKLGEGFYRQARAYMDLVDDPELKEYLDDLGNRLIEGAGLARGSFTFFMINDNTVNAFAVPGGYIGVHTGLLLTAKNEAEVASVLGHEIAHVTQQHIPRMISAQKKNLLPNLATLLAGILLGGQATEAAIAITSARSIDNQLTFTRSFEREADRIGINVLANSGYDTDAMADFFLRMQQANTLYETNAPQFLLTHPITTDRIAEAKSRAANYPHTATNDNTRFTLIHAKLTVAKAEANGTISRYKTKIRKNGAKFLLADHYGLALALLKGKKYSEAKKETALLLEHEPDQMLFKILEAQIASAQGNKSKSLELFSDIYNSNKSSLSAITYYAETLAHQGNYAEARKVLRKAVRKFPKSIVFYEMLSQAESESGSKMESHRALAEAYALLGNYPSATQQLNIARSFASKDDFYAQASITARIKEIKSIAAQEKQK
ncbi:MAG: M48 family metalloprotease [Pseudomonadota bacterium]|nr:M48 family metalloprotease [Pseudomonadota bacterium]